jgi:hypothetical protein
MQAGRPESRRGIVTKTYTIAFGMIFGIRGTEESSVYESITS